MTSFQKAIKYLAIALALFLALNIMYGIISAIGLIGSLFNGDSVNDNVRSYDISSDIQRLEIKINAADLSIKQGEVFSVESNLKNLEVSDKNGVLKIKETKRSVSTYEGAVLTVYVPYDTVFEKANIITGAGRFTADVLSADKIGLELGAGEVLIETLNAASEIDIEGGAGQIKILGGTLYDLDLDMGIGQLEITSEFCGKCEFDLGVGESDITVIGHRDDYKIEIEKGIGNIKIDGKTVSDFGSSGSGDNKIAISGGIGAINLNFKEKTSV